MHKLFWKCARSITLADLHESLDSITGKAKSDLQKTLMHGWYGAYFSAINNCDAYENNI